MSRLAARGAVRENCRHVQTDVFFRRNPGCTYANIESFRIRIAAGDADGRIERSTPQIERPWPTRFRPADESALFFLGSDRSDCAFRIIGTWRFFRNNLNLAVNHRESPFY